MSYREALFLFGWSYLLGSIVFSIGFVCGRCISIREKEQGPKLSVDDRVIRSRFSLSGREDDANAHKSNPAKR